MGLSGTLGDDCGRDGRRKDASNDGKKQLGWATTKSTYRYCEEKIQQRKHDWNGANQMCSSIKAPVSIRHFLPFHRLGKAWAELGEHAL